MSLPQPVVQELLNRIGPALNDPAQPMSKADLRRALHELRVAQADVPGDLLAFFFNIKGMVLYWLRDLGESLGAFNNAMNYDKLRATYPANAAGCLLEMGRYREAADVAERALKCPQHVGSDMVIALLNVAEARSHLNEPARAAEALRGAVEHAQPTSSFEMFRVADTIANVGAEDDAVEFFARYVALVDGVEIGSTPALDFIALRRETADKILALYPKLARALTAVAARRQEPIPVEHQIAARIDLPADAVAALEGILAAAAAP